MAGGGGVVTEFSARGEDHSYFNKTAALKKQSEEGEIEAGSQGRKLKIDQLHIIKMLSEGQGRETRNGGVLWDAAMV